jgi:hypothetical protein
MLDSVSHGGSEKVPAEPTGYPVFFTFQELVYGRGFVAGVTGSGRALMVREDDGAWWTYGVEPGGLAGNGGAPDAAFAAFRSAFREVLLDIAEECEDFTAFGRRIAEFVRDVDEVDGARWTAAAKAVRAGRVSEDRHFESLDRLDYETLCQHEVVNLATVPRPTPERNQVATLATAA